MMNEVVAKAKAEEQRKADAATMTKLVNDPTADGRTERVLGEDRFSGGDIGDIRRRQAAAPAGSVGAKTLLGG